MKQNSQYKTQKSMLKAIQIQLCSRHKERKKKTIRSRAWLNSIREYFHFPNLLTYVGS